MPNPLPNRTLPSHTAFHPAIEGLRAIAVLSVVAAHALVPGISGGYVGVDVFFVISGFLICRMLNDEIARNGRIDLADFWARRMRRLLPNATLTLLAVLMAGLFLVPGFMRNDLVKDVIMSALQVSNYHFASSAIDYFAQDNPQSALLHFWSLAVEEQFYIVWPATLALLCFATGHKALPIARVLLVIICATSFAGMLYALSISQPVAFFHSWARAWQLGIGGILAVVFARQQLAGHTTSDSAVFVFGGWIGLILIGISINFLDEKTLYPGIAALAPSLGAAAIIAAMIVNGRSKWGVNTILSARPLRWIGQRSYSWYLWHWPILTLAELALPAVPNIRTFGAIFALGVASIVYTFVENPIRRGERISMQPVPTILAGFASILMVVIAAKVFARVPHIGAEGTAVRNALMEQARIDLGQNYREGCHLDVEVVDQPECMYGLPTSDLRVVLFGDSHAAQWFSGIEAAARETGWAFQSWTKSSCPASDIRTWYPPRRAYFAECDTWRNKIMAELTGKNKPNLVIISNKLNYVGSIENPSEPGTLLRQLEAENIMRDGLKRTIQQLVGAGIAVVVVRDTPKMISSMAQCYVSGGGAACDRPRELALPKPWIDHEVVALFEDKSGVSFLDLTDQICDAALCPLVRAGEPIWRDSHHVRAEFALQQTSVFKALLANFKKDQLSH